ncbi:NAD(P)-binding protein [Deinococcus sp. HMF7604]|uniref:NAD(P)/FAD-dependent oxidoreductase n=1 Tax=Deinococcus betulae TaxID=2873312 RepID=UPI001CCC7CBA|nr:NAD(P)-binding protein [Deinococcus betulae]
MADLLVVGAGLAGLACARDAEAAGLHVLLLDKSRGVSGRAATRRVTLPGGEVARFDHGARFFTARHERTRTLAESGVQSGWNAVWTRGLAQWADGQVEPAEDGHPRYAPPAGLSTLGHTLARGLEVHSAAEITSLERRVGGWRVHARDGHSWEGARLVLNLPAPQLLALLNDVPLEGTASEGACWTAAQVRFAPCWAAGLVLARGPAWPHRATQVRHPTLDWVALEHTKRPPGHPPALLVQANADWSVAHLDATPEDVLPVLQAAATEIMGEDLEVQATFAHRWRYATPTRRAPGPCHWDAELALGWCGDWFTPDEHGPRVEATLLSGWALARWLQAPVGSS